MSKKQPQYFDANKREELFEKNQTVERSLKTSWKTMLTESAKKGIKAPTGADLMKKQGVKKMDEEDVKPVDDIDTPPVTDAPVDAPVDAPAPVDGEVPPGVDPAGEPAPAPISTDTPEMDPAADAAAPTVDPEAVEELKKFAASKLTSLPANGGTAESSVDETKGVFKQEIQDEQSGKTFVVLAFSKDVYPGLHDMANAIEPIDQAVPGAEVAPTDVPPVDGAAPAPTDMPATDAPAGDMPPVDGAAPVDAPAPTPTEEPAPVEEPKEDAEIKESDKEECEVEDCDEKKLEEARDPTVVGKKDWKLFFESRYSKK
jgi:hypothetical protein